MLAVDNDYNLYFADILTIDYGNACIARICIIFTGNGTVSCPNLWQNESLVLGGKALYAMVIDSNFNLYYAHDQVCFFNVKTRGPPTCPPAWKLGYFVMSLALDSLSNVYVAVADGSGYFSSLCIISSVDGGVQCPPTLTATNNWSPLRWTQTIAVDSAFNLYFAGGGSICVYSTVSGSLTCSSPGLTGHVFMQITKVAVEFVAPPPP